MDMFIIIFAVLALITGIVLVLLDHYIFYNESLNIKNLTKELQNTTNCFSLMELDKRAAKQLITSEYDDFVKKIEQRAKEIRC